MLADAISAALPDLRAEAEARMTSTCSIAPPGAERITDPDTGEVTFPPDVAVYTGRCRIRTADAQAVTTQAGGEEVFTYDYLVSIPFDEAGSADVRERMVCTIGASRDPALVGVKVQISKVVRGEDLTARRLLCNEVA